MAADTQVRVTLVADAKPYEKAMAAATKSTQATEEAVKGVTKSTAATKLAWATAGAAVTAFGAKAAGSLKECIDAAGDLNESTSKMKVIFGAASKDIIKFAENSASKLGMSKQAAYDAASTFATFGKAAGLAGQDLSKFSTDMVGLSADLASFYNTSPEDAIDAIGAALRGESEPIRRYGVLLDDATLKNRAMEMGIISSTKNALTPQQKALAAQAAILAQTGDAQGDFARTSDGLANSQRIMAAAIDNAKTQFGEALLPAMAKGVNIAAKVADAFGELPEPIRTTVAGLAGLTAVAATVGPGLAVAVKGVGALREGMETMQKTSLGGKFASAVSPIGNAGKSLLGVGSAATGLLGPVGLAAAAITGVALAGKALADAQIDKRVAAFGTALDQARINGQSLDSALSLTVVKMTSATKEVTNLQDAQSAMATSSFGLPGLTGATQQVKETVSGLKAFVDIAKQSGFAAREAQGQLAGIDKVLTEMDPDLAASEYQKLVAAMEAQGGSVSDLNGILPGYIQKVRDSKVAAADAANAEDQYAMSADKITEAINKAKSALFAFISAKLAAAGSADAMIGAEDRLATVVAANAKAHNGAKGAVEGHSKAALANREALRSEIAAISSNAQAVYDLAIQHGQTAPEAYEKSKAAILRGRDALIKQAQQAGLSKDAVAKLVTELTAFPDEVKTTLVAEVADYNAKLADAKAKLKDPNLTDPERTKLKAEIADLEAKVKTAKKRLGEIPDTVTPTVTLEDTATPKLNRLSILLGKVGSLQANIHIGTTGGLGGLDGAPGGSGSAIARALGTTTNKVGYCGQTVQGWLGGHGLHGPTAIAAWDGAPASMKHTGTPPAGVAVYFRGGKSGHVALSLGNGMIRSTDWPSAGQTGTTSIQTLQLAWGKKYVGWASQYATGGKVNGPGTATSDSIPARLSDGEWVINAKASKHYGDGLLAAINERRFATGGKAKAKAAAKKNAAASNLVDDIQWRADMGMLDQAGMLAALKSIKGATGQTAKDLALQIHRIEADMAQSAQDAAEKAAQTQQDAAEEAARIQQQAAEEAAAKLKAAEDRRDQYASSVAQGLINSLGLGQTAANGKRWGVGSMLGDFAKRAGQATEFSRMVQELTSRGLAQDVVQQVVAAGPVAGVDMARALMAMSQDQLATVNANQNAIRGAGAGMGTMLANAFYGVAGSQSMTIELTGGAPVVLQLDSRSIYDGQLELQRQMGGAYAFVSR